MDGTNDSSKRKMDNDFVSFLLLKCTLFSSSLIDLHDKKWHENGSVQINTSHVCISKSIKFSYFIFTLWNNTQKAYLTSTSKHTHTHTVGTNRTHVRLLSCEHNGGKWITRLKLRVWQIQQLLGELAYNTLLTIN